MSKEKFVNDGFILFLDVLIVGAGNWLFWLLLSKISSTSEIGQATTIISLVWMTTSFIQLGLEYPLLKSAVKSRILLSTLVLELAIVAAAIPIFLYALENMFSNSSSEISLIGILIIVFLIIGFVSRFSLLGISKVKTVLVVDTIGTIVKFGTGFALVSEGYGLIGMLIPFVLVHLTISIGCLIKARGLFEFKLGSKDQFKEIITRGLYNAPSKFSRLIILSLVVVLLASFGINESEIGIFYIALMISYLAAGGLGTSISYMVIPASSRFKIDLSSNSLRIGLSLTIPLIVALLVAPSGILSLVGDDYSAGGEVLMILALGIFPFIIMLNAIAKLNNLNKTKELIVIGATQIATFFIVFLILVDELQTIGAAYAILIAFIACSIPSLIWLGRKILRIVSFCLIALICGWGIGYLVNTILDLNPIVGVILSMGTVTAIILSLKVVSLSDINQIMKDTINKK